MQKPVVVDFAPHRVQYVGANGSLWYVALDHYPIAFELDPDGRIVNTLEEVPTLRTARTGLVEWLGDAVSWREAQDRPAVVVELDENDRGGAFKRDWRSAEHDGADALILKAPSRLLRIPLAFVPDGPLVARNVHHSIEEPALEDATVVFAGPERVLVEHAARGRFWLDVASTGLKKGDAVRIGGFFSEHGPCGAVPENPRSWSKGAIATHKLIATVIAFADRVERLPAPAFSEVGESVVVGCVRAPHSRP